MTKYRAKKTTAHGITFDSKREAARYGELLMMQKAGEISKLERQPSFELVAGVNILGSKRTSPAVRYVADFRYMQGGKVIVEDVKGMLTPVYKLKRHMMKALLGIDILETK